MFIDLLIVSMSLRVIGESMVVLAVLHMHHTMIVQHRIDKRVVLSYRQERILTWCGLTFIVVGFALEVFTFWW